MKTLKFSLFVAIIFAAVSFVSCNPVNPPEPPVTKIDTVIVQVNFSLPSGLVLSEAMVTVGNSVFQNGTLSKHVSSDVRNVTFTFTGDQAKSLIGSTLLIAAGLNGTYQNHTAIISMSDPDSYTRLVLKKGLNEITLHFTVQ